MPRFVACAGCGKSIVHTQDSLPAGQATCRECRGKRRQAICAYCSALFRSIRRSDGRLTRTCSKLCAQRLRIVESGRSLGRDPEKIRRNWQAKNWRRRALLREVESESYTLAEIAERDRFRCGLCGARIYMQKRSPDPLSASIDHIVPLSEGGSNMRSNVQLAHRRCNSAKGARGGFEQLALVG